MIRVNQSIANGETINVNGHIFRESDLMNFVKLADNGKLIQFKKVGNKIIIEESCGIKESKGGMIDADATIEIGEELNLMK